MKTISLRIDDEVDAALAALRAEQGRNETEVVADVLRRYVETERLKRMLQDPALARLYEELAAEDKALAEEGMSEHQRTLQDLRGERNARFAGVQSRLAAPRTCDSFHTYLNSIDLTRNGLAAGQAG